MPRAAERMRPSPELNAELEDHVGLIRAMRTEHTLNLTAQLITHLRHEDPKPELGRHGRDQWTRWPLPDAPQSAWDLEDEIGVIVRQQFVRKRGSSSGLDDAEEDYVEELIRHLTPMLIQYLEEILVLVEAHMFPRPPSLQDRINPFNWRDLANILASPAARGLIDGRMLGRYVDRMEGMVGPADGQPCPRQAIERRHIFDQQRARRDDLHRRLMSSLFE